jgi:hypothetical protein
VGILIDKNLLYDVISDFRDEDENILGLKIKVDDFVFWVVSVYGPNMNENLFFDRISNFCRNEGECPIFFGGNWNATVCTINNVDNIDTLNMHAPPQSFQVTKNPGNYAYRSVNRSFQTLVARQA